MIKIKKGDNVQVMTGKDSGKTGAVEKILIKDGKVIVAGANLYKRHIKGREGIEGGVIDIPKPINISNVQIVCKACNKPTRVGFEVTKDGKKRICKKCKGAIS